VGPKSTLLASPRSPATCRNTSRHSGDRKIHDTDGSPVPFVRTPEWYPRRVVRVAIHQSRRLIPFIPPERLLVPPRHEAASRHRHRLTDPGASRLVDPFGLATWEEVLALLDESGPEELLRQVRAAEAVDPEGRQWPRTKRSDDATAVYLDIDGPANH
jgi:hypothetical protein